MSQFNQVSTTNTLKAPQDIGLSSQSVAFSHYNNLSAQLPIDPQTGNLVAGGIHAQAVQCFKNIQAILESMHHVMNDVVKLTFFVRDVQDMDAIDKAFATFFTGYVPARTVVAVAALPMDALVQIEALVSHGEGSIPNAPQAGDLVKVARNTSNAPMSKVSTQTVAFSHYNNLSAQLPIDVSTGQLVAGGVQEQTRQCFKNIKTILESIGHVMSDVVRITVFVKNVSDIDSAHGIYKLFFPAYVPALTMVPVAGLPMNALVQVEAVVSHGDGTPPQPVEDALNIIIKANNTAAAPHGHSSQTVAFSHYNHISAQLPLSATTGELVNGGIQAQATQCLVNIREIVTSIGHSLADVVKVNIAVKNLADMGAVNDVYTTFFPQGIPARRVIGVSELPKNALIQIDVVVSNAEGTPPGL